ncbi:MAG: hypothetical protein ACYC3Q_08195 [Gemmatimonadaceae bacterium]
MSPVSTLYREFLSRAPADEPSVTAWIVENRHNEYEPFGTLVHGGARTRAEFLAYQEEQAHRRTRALAAELERQREAAAHKAQAATERLANAVRRGDLKAVQALFAKGADWRSALPDGRSLIELARQSGNAAVAEYLASRGVQ